MVFGGGAFGRYLNPEGRAIMNEINALLKEVWQKLGMILTCPWGSHKLGRTIYKTNDNLNMICLIIKRLYKLPCTIHWYSMYIRHLKLWKTRITKRTMRLSGYWQGAQMLLRNKGNLCLVLREINKEGRGKEAWQLPSPFTHVRTQHEVGILQPRRWPLLDTEFSGTVILDLSASRMVRNKCLLFISDSASGILL